MKKVLTTMMFCLMLSPVMAQEAVKEKDLLGEWKMVIDVDMDEVERELENENWLAQKIASSVTGLVTDIIEEIDIRMDFRDNGEVKIIVNAFDEREVEYAQWEISRRGELMIFDEDHDRWKSTHINFGQDDDDVWMMDGDRIYQFENERGRLERGQVYLERVKR